MSPPNSKQVNDLQVAFLGFGEAATAIVEGWTEDQTLKSAKHARVFDIARDDALRKEAFVQRCATNDVIDCPMPREAISGADVIFSLVTADQTLAAAKSATTSISDGAFYFDCNSSAPETKRAAAALIAAAGGVYIDVAIMSPIYPRRHKSPMLICGPSTDDASEVLRQLGMDPAIIDGDVGKASAVKMMRSVMMKGMEALMAECALASRKAGVSEQVFASLEKSYPGVGWVDRCEYNLERMMVHGKRRAAEMREAALTVAQLGLDNPMSRATVQWQQTVGDLGVDPGSADFYERTDSILDQMDQKLKSTIDRDDFGQSEGEPEWA